MSPNEIKSAREKLGMAQNEFAARLGVRQATVSDWERGKVKPSALALARIESLEAQEQLGLWRGRAQAEADRYGELLKACGTFNHLQALEIAQERAGTARELQDWRELSQAFAALPLPPEQREYKLWPNQWHKDCAVVALALHNCADEEKEPELGLPSLIDALRFRIEQYGWTDQKFAEEIGMNQGHFSQVMSGKRRLPLSARIKAHALGVPAKVLLQSEKAKP